MPSFTKLTGLISSMLLLILLTACTDLLDRTMEKATSIIDGDLETAEEDKTNETANKDTEIDTKEDNTNGEIHRSKNNPYQLSSEMIHMINAIGLELSTIKAAYTLEEFQNEFIEFFDFSKETITEDELKAILADLFENINRLPTDYPIAPLPNATYLNYAFIGTQYHYNGEDSYDYWFGTFTFEGSLTDAIAFFQKSLMESGFTIDATGTNEQDTLGLGDAIITAQGEIDDVPYEAGLLFTENTNEAHQVIISFVAVLD